MADPSTLIELREYGKGVVFSPSDEERRILGRFSDALSIRDVDATQVEVTSNNDSVGGLVLSRNTRIIVRPKVPIASLLQLIMVGSGLETLRTLRGMDQYAQGSIVDWLAMMLVLEVRALISSGLRRAYVLKNEPLQIIRGRIDFKSMLRRPWDVNVTCKYTPFSIDTPENQILVSTLEAMSICLLLPEVKTEVVETSRIFEGVSVRGITRADFENIRINRLNQQYAPAIALCRIFAEGSGLEFGPGSAVGHGFFVSMNVLFERALTNMLRKHILGVLAQRSIRPVEILSGGPAYPVTMFPDITIVDRTGRAALVLDAKYKRPVVQGQFGLSFDSANIYQIVAYAKALDCEGILVYPQIDDPVDVTMRIRDVAFSIATVDLSGDVNEAFKQFAGRIIRKLESDAA